MNNYFSKTEIFIYSFISLFTVVFLWDYYFIYPLKFFVTSIHEGFHGLFTIITGGEVISIKLNTDGSGSLLRRGGFNLLISPAGYIGTAFVGALFILASRKRLYSEIIISIFSFYVILINIIYIDSYFSIVFIIVLLVSIILIYIVYKTDYDNHLSLFLGTFFMMSSVEDIKTYLLSDISNKTDAGLLASRLGMDFLTPVIALAFFIITLIIYYKTVKIILNLKDIKT